MTIAGMEKMADQMPLTSFLWSYKIREKSYLEKELTAATLTNPSFDWHDLHQVVSECDGEDGNGSAVEERVELADLADEGDCLEVFIEQFLGSAGETTFVGAAVVGDS